MHTPNEFCFEFTCYPTRKTDLQMDLLWRDQWAGERIDWDSIRVIRIAEYGGAIQVYLEAEIRSEFPWNIIFLAPVGRAMELGRFSAGDYVHVSGVLDEKLWKSGTTYVCPLRGDATLSPGKPPTPPAPEPVQNNPPAKQSSGCLSMVLVLATLIIYGLLR